MTPGEIFQQYKALIVTVAGLSIAAVVILIGATIWQRAGKVTFELTVVPGDALVKMNATPVAAGTLYVKPGTYEVTATKDYHRRSGQKYPGHTPGATYHRGHKLGKTK